MKEEKNSRRSFLTKTIAGISGSVIATGLPLSALASNTNSEVPDSKHDFLTKPYLQAPTNDGITIMWLTNQLCLNWVEYGETEKLGIKAQQCAHGMMNINSRINTVTLTNLKPDTTYYYKVFSKQILDFQPYKITFGDIINSETYYFKTLNPKAKEVSWLVLNDIHDRPKSFGELIQLNQNKPYDFVFLNGDMFDYQTDENQIINHLLNPCSLFSTEKPFMLVRGNHETRGKYSRNLLDYYYNYDKKEYYTFKMGPVFTIVLDTGEDKKDSHPVYGGTVNYDSYREEQAVWLEKQMKSKAFKNAPFRVVMMHIPHYHSDEEHGTTECRRLFGPLFEKYKIDLFVAGHTHEYGMFEPNKDHSHHFVIGGGPETGIRTLIRIEANTKVLNLQMLNDSGKEIGLFQLNSKR
ncbi:FN3 domain-containing metallophosphoesterase family protein [Flavobacterium sp. PL02]|uniref:FN3 domain-containing metallophosphoesterase family protein n=1 Tax=Flavobacterium sp. PL02 TaxID=3088354 RepID=UPI002B23E2A8|nr:FN3 domain-containing metallophosphoesterase family protein [Flavobacterium sp. PL02]MEA9411977.1 FN3 domain-containing metallophosphoesterase family protein [Flavobacterium sp. PL02]